MTKLHRDMLAAIKKSSASQEEMVAHIHSFDRKPDETFAAAAIAPKRRGRPPKQKYETRDMTAEA